MIFASAAKLAYEDHISGAEKKRGVSFFPVIPLMPVSAIGLKYACDYFFYPIGTYVVLSVHLLLLSYAILYSMHWTKKINNPDTNILGYTGFWAFNIVNILICLFIILGVPYFIWQLETHWIWVALTAIVSFFGSGFFADRVLFKLKWAEYIFGEIKDPHHKGISYAEFARQAEKERKEKEAAARQAENEFYKKESARRTKNRHIDFKDFSTEVEIAEHMLFKDLDQKVFTIEDIVPSILEEDAIKLAKEGRPIHNPKKYYIDESGIRIIPKNGPEEFYTYDDIEEIELKYFEVDSGVFGEGRWERPLPIYKSNLLFITAGGKKREIPYTDPDKVIHAGLPWDATWFIIQNYNKVREQEFKKTIKSGGEVPIGFSKAKETVYMNSKGLRCRNLFFSIEALWWATIWENGNILIKDKKGNELHIILDYALPESYLFLYLIRKMILPKQMPLKDKKFLPGYINRMKSLKAAVFFATISILCFIVCGYFSFKAISAASWPAALGKVLSCEVILKDLGEDFSMYELIISYKYYVEGINYIGDTFKYGSKSFHFEKNARRLAKEFQEGKEIPVYYNPGAPGQAVLERGLGFYFYLWLIGAFFCLLLAIEFHVFIFKKAEEIRKRFW